MIVTSLTNNVVYPNEMGDMFRQCGARVAEGTDTNKAAKFISDKYGLEYKKVSSDDELVNYIANGYVAMVNVAGGSVFSTGGHIIFVCGYANGLIQVHDPYMYTNKFNGNGRKGKVQVQGNDVWISVANWKAYAKATVRHVFKIPVENPTKYTVGQRILIDAPIGENIPGTDKVKVNSNGYEFVVHKSVAKVYGLGEVVSIEGNGLYKVKIFDDEFLCKEEYMSDKF